MLILCVLIPEWCDALAIVGLISWHQRKKRIRAADRPGRARRQVCRSRRRWGRRWPLCGCSAWWRGAPLWGSEPRSTLLPWTGPIAHLILSNQCKTNSLVCVCVREIEGYIITKSTIFSSLSRVLSKLRRRCLTGEISWPLTVKLFSVLSFLWTSLHLVWRSLKSSLETQHNRTMLETKIIFNYINYVIELLRSIYPLVATR